MDIYEEIVEYEYDGEHLDTAEIEMKMQDDELTYATIEEVEIEEVETEEFQNVSSRNSFRRFRWTPTYVKLLIKGYFDRRFKFRDPKTKKKNLWHEIFLEMRLTGLAIEVDDLDKKWRNLKKTYSLIKEKKDQGHLGRGVRWEHYEVFELLYAKDESTIDTKFLEEYFSNLEPGIEEGIGEVQGNDDFPHPFSWCPQSVDFLLKSYLDRKERFRNRRTKKKKLWSEIWQEMMLSGYNVDNEDVLDRKMRNMKKTYKELRKTKGYEPITWEYFDRLDEIFKDDPSLIDENDAFVNDTITDTQGPWSSSSEEDNTVSEPFENTANSPNHSQEEYDWFSKSTENQNVIENKASSIQSPQRNDSCPKSTKDQHEIQNIANGSVQRSQQTNRNTALSPIHSPSYNWCPKSTKFFLKSYIRRKKKFRDPNVLKNKLWTEILQEMNTAGFSIENIQVLETKMQNMTKTFKTIKEKNKKSTTGQGQIRWEHLAAFEKLYSIDNEPEPTAPIKLENLLSPIQTSLNSKEKNINRMSALHLMRKKQLLIEEKKAQLTEKVHETLKETNKLLRERNELLRQLIHSNYK